MEINSDDILGMIGICLASVSKQRETAPESMKSYLDGYEEGLKMLKEMVERRKNA